MKNRLAVLAIAITMIAGSAYAQNNPPTQSGGSEATAEGAQRGVPLLPIDKSAGFYTDDSMATLRPDAEMSEHFKKMTPEDQKTFRESCKEEKVKAHKDVPAHVVELCKKIRVM